MTIEIDIAVECEEWRELGDLDSLVHAAIEAARAEADRVLAVSPEVSVLLCDDARIRELNRDWRSMDKPTNVLSFPASSPSQLASAPLLGDMSALPPSFIATAEYDVFRDSSTQMASRLAQADRLRFFKIYPGMAHLFFGFSREVPGAQQCVSDVSRFLAEHLPA